MADHGERSCARGYRVVGRVQGVGFRWWTRRTAMELGLVGSVRNARDGSVEVQAAGPEAELVALEEALRRGPPSAYVDRLEIIPPDARMPTASFEIVL